MIVTIDFSINSPGICIYNEEGIHFASIIKEGVAKESYMNILKEYGIQYSILPKYKSTGNSSKDEQGYTHDAIQTAEAIATIIKSINKGKGDREKNILVLEGFSFGSTGNRLAQISGYQFITRVRLLSEMFSINNLYVYPPQSVKSVAGAAKRGEGKVGMIESFMMHTAQETLPGLMENSLYKQITTDHTVFQTQPTKRSAGGKWMKPLDDIVDSYFLLQTYFVKNEIDPKTFIF